MSNSISISPLTGDSYIIPKSKQDMELKTFLKNNKSKKIIVVMGLGFVGSVMSIICANSEYEEYAVIGLDLKNKNSYWKIASINENKFQFLLNKSEKKYQMIKKRNSKYGKKAIFGLMPDWNPAEIIGFQPNLFSYSLYKLLVTDKIWATARKQMGYKELKDPKLMYSFTGKPFMDLRTAGSQSEPRRERVHLQCAARCSRMAAWTATLKMRWLDGASHVARSVRPPWLAA